MYVCLKTLCLSWKMKHTRSNMNLRAQLKLQKIKENDTPIEESSCQSIEDQRKRYPYRGIVVCIFVYVWKESKNHLPVRVFASVCKIKPSACMDLFKNPQPVMKMKHTYTLKFLRISCFPKLSNMYVCLKSSCFIMENAQTSTQNTSFSSTEIKL